MLKNKKGFTLIELLVVIAIIGLLSTLAVVSLNNAREKSRDAKRISDIKQVQTALELFFVDQQGYPPLAAAGTALTLGGAGNIESLDDTGFVAGACGGGVCYMGQVPANPTPGGQAYTYTAEETIGGSAGDCVAVANCLDYQITFELEGQTGSLGSGVHTGNSSGLQ